MYIKHLLGIIVSVLIIWAKPVSAVAIPDLYNTGVGINGVSLPNGTSPDPHYTVIASTDGSVASTTTVGNLDPGTWIADSTTSAWIAPTAEYFSNGLGSPVGHYDYQTTFTLPSGANSVTISADMAVDDFEPATFLNGQAVGVGVSLPADFEFYTPISFTSSNVFAGTNTLVFETYNIGAQAGLRIDGITGTYTTVPEPASVSLIGFALLSFRRRAI